MAYLGLLAVRVVAQPFECLVLLNEELYRLEGGGVICEFMLPLTVEGGPKEEMQDWTGQRRCWECRLVHEEEKFEIARSLRLRGVIWRYAG
jgi:hypothetical protein